MPRMLRRAAVLGTTAHVAKKRGAEQAQQQAQQQAAAQPAAPPPPAAPAEPAPASMDEKAEQLTKLKGLLDSGILTQEEFDTQKQQILAS